MMTGKMDRNRYQYTVTIKATKGSDHLPQTLSLNEKPNRCSNIRNKGKYLLLASEII